MGGSHTSYGGGSMKAKQRRQWLGEREWRARRAGPELTFSAASAVRRFGEDSKASAIVSILAVCGSDRNQ